MPLQALNAPGSNKSAKLLNAVTVIRLAVNPKGDLRYAGISELPKGAQVEMCGKGFNERTVKLQWQGQFFFAFAQDLEPPVTSAILE